MFFIIKKHSLLIKQNKFNACNEKTLVKVNN